MDSLSLANIFSAPPPQVPKYIPIFIFKWNFTKNTAGVQLELKDLDKVKQ